MSAVRPPASSWRGHAREFAWVAIGGGLGGLTRLGVSELLERIGGLPTLAAVLAINLVGGVIAGLATARWGGVAGRRHHLAFVVPGFCGGFTTFAGFAQLCAEQADQGRWAVTCAALFGGCVIGVFAARRAA